MDETELRQPQTGPNQSWQEETRRYFGLWSRPHKGSFLICLCVNNLLDPLQSECVRVPGRQKIQMTADSLTRSGIGCFTALLYPWQQWASKDFNQNISRLYRVVRWPVSVAWRRGKPGLRLLFVRQWSDSGLCRFVLPPTDPPSSPEKHMFVLYLTYLLSLNFRSINKHVQNCDRMFSRWKVTSKLTNLNRSLARAAANI